MNRITVKNLTKSFGDKPLFSGVSFTLEPGFTCLYGPSGCGKTTLGRLISGLEKPDSGTVEGVEGLPAFLFQEHRLFPHASSLQNVACVSRDRNAVRDASELLLSLGFTEEDLNKKPSALSGGMKQRVALARLLLYARQSGNTVILDEPFRGLDPDTKQIAASLLKAALSDRIVLLITHDTADAALTEGRLLSFENILE